MARIWPAWQIVALALGMQGTGTAYDPLRTDPASRVRTLELTVHDTKRDRSLPIRVYLPDKGSAAPVVLFSHGLGGSRRGNAYLGEHWARRGYVVVAVQHPGSDDAVWRNARGGNAMASLQRAASGENFLLRVADIPAVLDQLERWNTQDGHPLRRRLDMGHVGMSGHSFGARTTQAVSGESFGVLGQRYTDRRIRAAIAFSPSWRQGGSPTQAFGKVAIPWLLMTGTRDVARIGGATVQDRLAVFPALPAGDKYELVLHNAEHHAFADHPLLPGQSPRNPNHHRAILAISTAFWDAYLSLNSEARHWLQSDAVKAVLEPKDRWQRK